VAHLTGEWHGDGVNLDPANLFVSFMVGLVGMALLIWGRSQKRVLPIAAGVALIAATFVVPGWPWLLLVTAGVIAGLVLAAKAGL